MTRDAYALHRGDRIHTSPHDVYAGGDRPISRTRLDADITLTGVCPRGSVVVLAWGTIDGPHGTIVYDATDLVEVVELAEAAA